jgi:dUTP pyrophosphatase
MLIPTLRFCRIRKVKSPTRAHSLDAGIDFFVPTDFDSRGLDPNESIKIPSGIRARVPEGFALIAFNKSGVATKLGLIVGACVVDSGYQGEIHLHLVNSSNKNVWIIPDTKIVQFILVPIALSMPEEVREHELFPEKSLRGSGGFGSTNVAYIDNPTEMGMYDDDPNPYHGTYSED